MKSVIAVVESVYIRGLEEALGRPHKDLKEKPGWYVIYYINQLEEAIADVEAKKHMSAKS